MALPSSGAISFSDLYGKTLETSYSLTSSYSDNGAYVTYGYDPHGLVSQASFPIGTITPYNPKYGTANVKALCCDSGGTLYVITDADIGSSATVRINGVSYTLTTKRLISGNY